MELTTNIDKEMLVSTSIVREQNTQATDQLNIYQKIARVQRSVDVLQKDSSGYGYKYTSEAEILPKINAAMAQYGLTVFPNIVPGTTHVEPYSYIKKNKKGVDESVNEFHVTADMFYRWVDNDTGAYFDVPWSMSGNQADSSQAFGSALTYSNRYFLLKFFRCATVNDDPDAIRSKQRENQNKNILSDTIARVDEIVQDVVAKSPGEREAIREIVSKYVNRRDENGRLIKTGDYFSIGKKAQASALLLELERKYKGTEE